MFYPIPHLNADLTASLTQLYGLLQWGMALATPLTVLDNRRIKYVYLRASMVPNGQPSRRR